LSGQADLGRIDRDPTARTTRRLVAVRILLPLGWLLAAMGYWGPWISHPTAALTLSGVDMGEFVKFLPAVQDGSLHVVRQLFYLPPLVVVVSIALMVGLRRLRYAWPLRVLFLLFAIPVSLQLLPPAWSPASLMTGEFRVQTLALGLCWLLLAGFWLLGRLPPWLAGSLAAALALAALALSAWQFLLVKPAIDEVYGLPPLPGWGLALCLAGLATMALASILLVVRTRARSSDRWTGS
jgi:hypothetical protein